MTELGKDEDQIFKERFEKEQDFKRRDREKKKRMKKSTTPHWTPNRPKTVNGGVSGLYQQFSEPVALDGNQKAAWEGQKKLDAPPAKEESAVAAYISQARQETPAAKRAAPDQGDEEEEEEEDNDEVRY